MNIVVFANDRFYSSSTGLLEDLRRNHTVWTCQDDIDFGDDWDTEVGNAVTSCDLIVVVANKDNDLVFNQGGPSCTADDLPRFFPDHRTVRCRPHDGADDVLHRASEN
jgi:hypothetical protein